MLSRPFIRALASSIPRAYPRTFVSHPIVPKRLPFTATSHFSTKPVRMAEYKLKDLSSLNLTNGDKVEVEVEGIEGGKVLLVKLDNKVHAMNANCTHYGAPLKTGVLAPDGRLTCPWHGACFNVSTGDVEDAPALDALNKFDVTEKNGGVYIKGEESAIKGGRRMANVKCKSQGQDKVVVVGGGSGAFGAVQSLRELGFKGSITMISNEGYLPIDRTKLSKALIADSSKVALRSEDFYSSADIAFVQDTATAIDFGKKYVVTKSGSEYPYTKLILATGGTPKNLPLPGFKDLSNIFVLRHVQNVQDIMKAVGDKGKNIVIVGSSFIGMEVANALAKENTVSIIGMEEAPLERIMGKEVGRIFQKSLEKNGAKFYMGASVDSASPSTKDKNTVGAVKLKDGTEIDADLVILGIGVGPATEFLRGNDSVKLEKDGSIQTDEFFQVKGMDDIYALGDIATYPYHGPGGNGTMTRIEHWNVAQNSGRTVAQLIAQPSTTPKPFIPIFWSAQGGQLRYCGNTPNGWDDLILQGKPEESKFAAYYTHGDTVVAVATMMMDPIMTKCAELMRRGNMPSKKDIQGGVDVLTVDLPGQVAM